MITTILASVALVWFLLGFIGAFYFLLTELIDCWIDLDDVKDAIGLFVCGPIGLWVALTVERYGEEVSNDR